MSGARARRYGVPGGHLFHPKIGDLFFRGLAFCRDHANAWIPRVRSFRRYHRTILNRTASFLVEDQHD
jgi:hypothetical protein